MHKSFQHETANEALWDYSFHKVYIGIYFTCVFYATKMCHLAKTHVFTPDDFLALREIPNVSIKLLIALNSMCVGVLSL